MKRITALALGATATLSLLAPTALASASTFSADGHGRPATYLLTGDEGGSKFEGIGADQRRGTFYVSEVTGGEIHRGTAGQAQTAEWLAGDGTDGRWTARGIKVDGAGNVYIAGGPNAIQHPGAPNLWVYSPDGELLAALTAPGDNVFLNDVVIGPDGAAYFTDSNTPRLFRVTGTGGDWQVTEWANAAGTVSQPEGFNLGGLVVSADRSALVVAQGTTGQLWRFSLADGSVSAVDTGGARVGNADGLVRIGERLVVVQNFTRQVSSLHLSADGTRAVLLEQRASDPDRVLTTAAVLHGRILYVDSKFDEPTATGPYEVISSSLTTADLP